MTTDKDSSIYKVAIKMDLFNITKSTQMELERFLNTSIPATAPNISFKIRRLFLLEQDNTKRFVLCGIHPVETMWNIKCEGEVERGISVLDALKKTTNEHFGGVFGFDTVFDSIEFCQVLLNDNVITPEKIEQIDSNPNVTYEFVLCRTYSTEKALNQDLIRANKRVDLLYRCYWQLDKLLNDLDTIDMKKFDQLFCEIAAFDEWEKKTGSLLFIPEEVSNVIEQYSNKLTFKKCEIQENEIKTAMEKAYRIEKTYEITPWEKFIPVHTFNSNDVAVSKFMDNVLKERSNFLDEIDKTSIIWILSILILIQFALMIYIS